MHERFGSGDLLSRERERIALIEGSTLLIKLSESAILCLVDGSSSSVLRAFRSLMSPAEIGLAIRQIIPNTRAQ